MKREELLEWFPDADADKWLRAVNAAIADAETDFRNAKAEEKWGMWRDDKIDFNAPPPAWKAAALYVRKVLAAHVAQAIRQRQSPQRLEEFLAASRNSIVAALFEEKLARMAASSVDLEGPTCLVYYLFMRQALQPCIDELVRGAWQKYSETLKRDQGNGAHPAREPRKRGPRPKMHRHARVYEILQREAGENWVRTWKREENLEKITDALDEAKVPLPVPWKKRELLTWADALEKDKENLVKSLSHSISQAQQKTIAE